jgi:hypothetical protein
MEKYMDLTKKSIKEIVSKILDYWKKPEIDEIKKIIL